MSAGVVLMCRVNEAIRGSTYLQRAIQEKFFLAVLVLLNNGANPNLCTSNEKQEKSDFPIFMALRGTGEASIKFLELLLNHPKIELENLAEILKRIGVVSGNAFPSMKYAREETTTVPRLYKAVELGNLRAVELLLARSEVKPNVVFKVNVYQYDRSDPDRWCSTHTEQLITPLVRATINGNIAIIRLLLIRPNLNVNFKGVVDICHYKTPNSDCKTMGKVEVKIRPTAR